jgi:predicted AlkP superfamily phosphohydrolase/phosphomutase
MKILVLGFDGASPRLVEKWLNDLPTFRKFKEEGIYGLSIPPAPAQTPVAWTTFMTGKNPGKHGIFSFAMRRLGTYERRIINPALIKSKTIWRVLSEHGKKVALINMPMTPYEKLKGYVIPGFLHRNEGLPSPSRIKQKISRKLGIDHITGDLETDVVNEAKLNPSKFFRRTNEITDELAEIGLFLMQEEEWDVFTIVFMGTDRIQHFFWKYIDEKHPQHRKNVYYDEAKKYYEKMDNITKEFMDTAPKDTLTFLLSDHGFCPIQKEMLVNIFFLNLGVLKAQDNEINLEKSQAVSYGYGDIWLNMRGREPKGIIPNEKSYEKVREKIIASLMKLEIDQEPPIKAVKKREEIYWGPYLNEAPDLLIFFNPGWQAARRLETDITGSFIDDNPKWSGGHDGTHDPVDVPGFFGALGPKLKTSKKVKCHLWDIAPTILGTMKIPILNDMDGKVISL